MTAPRASHWAEQALLLSVAVLVRLLPESVALGLGAMCGRIAGSLLRIRRTVVQDNIERAFPERSSAWRRRVGAACYHHLGREAAALLRLEGMSSARIRERCGISGLDRVRRELAKGRGVLLLTGHLGNWEVGGAAVAAHEVPLDVVARRQRNPLFEARLRRMREELGMRVIYRHEATRQVIRSLREPRAVALVADQNAAVGGVFVDFFGTPAATVRGPGLLAARTDAAVMTALVRRLPGRRACYHLAIEPLEFERSGDPVVDLHALTRAYHQALETAIRESPDQYFWFHKRWKTRPEGTEPRSGGAVPDAPEQLPTSESGARDRIAEDSE